MSKKRNAVVVVVVEEKQKRREEERRERRQQVSAWESRVKYLVLVKRRRKRTRRTRLQFTVHRSRVTGHSSRTACDRLCNQSSSCRSAHNGTRPDHECKKERAQRNVQRTEREREPFINQQSSLINKFNTHTHTHTLSDQQQNDVSRLGE